MKFENNLDELKYYLNQVDIAQEKNDMDNYIHYTLLALITKIKIDQEYNK